MALYLTWRKQNLWLVNQYEEEAPQMGALIFTSESFYMQYFLNRKKVQSSRGKNADDND